MEIHELAPDFREYGGRHGSAVDPGPPPSARGDLALQHQRVIFHIDPALVGEFCDSANLRHIEYAFDRRFLGARADEIGARPLTEEQAKGANDNRLARTGLAREHVEPLGQWQRHRFDYREVSDAKLGQHQCASSRSGSPPHPSFTLMRSKKVVPAKPTMRT